LCDDAPNNGVIVLVTNILAFVEAAVRIDSSIVIDNINWDFQKAVVKRFVQVSISLGYLRRSRTKTTEVQVGGLSR
jgi:hypothetical protein